jgi:hypothetical protein
MAKGKSKPEKTTEQSPYLLEKSLGDFLKVVFPENQFLHNKEIPKCGKKYRFDYRCEDLSLIVEFDGPKHYTSAAQIIGDYQRDEFTQNLGYRTVRFPFFVQMCPRVVQNLFELPCPFTQVYPHGFNSNTVIFPADFCELGIARFNSDLEKFNYIREDIIVSLRNKIKLKGNQRLVLPPSLLHLVD